MFPLREGTKVEDHLVLGNMVVCFHLQSLAACYKLSMLDIKTMSARPLGIMRMNADAILEMQEMTGFLVLVW